MDQLLQVTAVLKVDAAVPLPDDFAPQGRSAAQDDGFWYVTRESPHDLLVGP